MAKGSGNKQLQARLSYLDRASRYLAREQYAQTAQVDTGMDDRNDVVDTEQHRGLSQLLTSHLRAVSLKGQIRLPKELKHSFCKVCEARLIDTVNCDIMMENLSKGGKKPWVDVKVIRCRLCGTSKRFPIGAKRQTKQSARSRSIKEEEASRMTNDTNGIKDAAHATDT